MNQLVNIRNISGCGEEYLTSKVYIYVYIYYKKHIIKVSPLKKQMINMAFYNYEYIGTLIFTLEDVSEDFLLSLIKDKYKKFGYDIILDDNSIGMVFISTGKIEQAFKKFISLFKKSAFVKLNKKKMHYYFDLHYVNRRQIGHDAEDYSGRVEIPEKLKDEIWNSCA